MLHELAQQDNSADEFVTMLHARRHTHNVTDLFRVDIVRKNLVYLVRGNGEEEAGDCTSG